MSAASGRSRNNEDCTLCVGAVQAARGSDTTAPSMRRASTGRSTIAQLIKPLAYRFVATIEAEIAVQAKAILVGWSKRNAKDQSERVPVPLNPRRTEANGQRKVKRAEEDSVAVSSPPPSAQLASEAAESRFPRSPSTVKTKVSRPSRQKIETKAPDPGDAERPAELNRRRSIRRPARDDRYNSAGTVATRVDAQTGEDPNKMKTLEEKVRDGTTFLPDLSPARRTATIAAWAGQARIYQTDGQTWMAAHLLLERLRHLARAMDAGFIEALDPSWSTSDWQRYVKVKEMTVTESGLSGSASAAGNLSPTVTDYSNVWK
jgi:hypothetical protein